MELFQQKVIREKIDLDDKIKNLTVFIDKDPLFKNLSEAEQGRLRVQVLIMMSYSAILLSRIKVFGKEIG